MGYVLPDGADAMLDLIGVGWPNVDEDDYRDMANDLRDFNGNSIDDVLKAAQRAHDAAVLERYGSAGLPAQAHGEFGTDMSAYGDKSMRSFTTDPKVAEYFAEGGPVNRTMVHPREGVWQTLPDSTESEVLIPHMIEAELWDKGQGGG
ncbi:hypothetical protein WDH52_02995 [Streptomyces sp. TRM70308]|uniref:hypothetical protein n=1 Tax=Streptomyces sp. TRM70308 TaxID=3131932 RepID=UPI003D01C007